MSSKPASSIGGIIADGACGSTIVISSEYVLVTPSLSEAVKETVKVPSPGYKFDGSNSVEEFPSPKSQLKSVALEDSVSYTHLTLPTKA